MGGSDIERHTIAVLVDNEPGVLARVIGLFSGRGYNIESLTVAEVDKGDSLSRITVVTSGTRMIIEQIKAQLSRLVPVRKVHDLTDEGPLRRARAGADQGGRQGRDADRIAAPRRCLPRPVIDSTTEKFCLRDDRLGREARTPLSTLMEPLGLVEVSRTGAVRDRPRAQPVI